MSKVTPGYLAPLLPTSVPEEAESFDVIMKDFEKHIMPGVTHWQSPNFYGWYPANSSFPAMLGDMYSNMINCIGFNWMCSPSCTELETIVMDWTAQMIGLDEGFLSKGKGGGVILGSASEATITVMIAAKSRLIRRYAEKGIHQDEIMPKLIAYATTETHSCTAKGAQILGIKLRNLEVNDEFSCTPDIIKAALEQDVASGLIPFYFTGTIGTTSTAATDDIPGIARILEAHPDVWFHVDAAYAGSAMACEEFRSHLAGTEKIDSFSFNLHKWGLVNFDCSPMYVRDRRPLLEAMDINPSFLTYKESAEGLVTDYRHWQIPLGRRFRSLKAWFTLRNYGAKGFRAHIRRHVELAKLVTKKIEAEPDLFEMMAPQRFSLIVFRLHPKGVTNEKKLEHLNRNLQEYLLKELGTFLTQTDLKGKFALRMAIGSPQTQESHILDTWAKIQTAAKAVMNS